MSKLSRLTYAISLLLMLILTAACASTPSLPTYYAPQDLALNRADFTTIPPSAIADWSADELTLLRSLWLGSLPPLPPDPSNNVADNPRAAALGHRLFFDRRMSANQQVACASCHVPQLAFTDGFPRAFGTRQTQRNTMTLLGVAYSSWLTWDGHHDSLWSQALEPIEHPDEHGATRLHLVHLVRQDEAYRTAYEALFGPLPDELADFSRFPDSGGPRGILAYQTAWQGMQVADQATATKIYVNLGKAIAAYERLLLPGPSRFDEYVQMVLNGNVSAIQQPFTADEIAGLRLFIGRADCVRCHHGPLFTDQTFHNTGTPPTAEGVADRGRAQGVKRVLSQEFNCLSQFNDVSAPTCADLQALDPTDVGLSYQFKTPTLRHIAQTAPYMHTGQLATLAAVLQHYNEAPAAPLGQSELVPLALSESQLVQLSAFLQTLSATPATPSALLEPPQE